jgi:hypothetical protein
MIHTWKRVLSKTAFQVDDEYPVVSYGYSNARAHVAIVAPAACSGPPRHLFG